MIYRATMGAISASIVCFLIMLSLSSKASGEEIAVGAAIGTLPGITLHYSQNYREAYHGAVQYTADRAAFSADYQRIHIPRRVLEQTRLGLYTGLGLRGETSAEESSTENFHLRIPVGVQLNFTDIYLQIFAETAGLIGPLPKTSPSLAALCGVRAYF